jgi:hypothetical protein
MYEGAWTMNEQEFQSWKNDLLSKIKVMIKDWEDAMGDDDKTYYSLALRRVYDMIDGRSAFDQLPILETEDTPDDNN